MERNDNGQFIKGSIPWNKNVPCDEETKEKLSNIQKGRHYSQRTEFKCGEHKSRSTEFKQGHIPWDKDLKGIHLSPETEFKKGQTSGEKSHSWKGDEAGYDAVHSYLRRHYPCQYLECPICGEEKQLHLHNLTGNYTRNIEDYQYVCKGCHAWLHKQSGNFMGIITASN